MTDNTALPAVPKSLSELIKVTRTFQSKMKFCDRNERLEKLYAELEHIEALISAEESGIQTDEDCMSRLQADAAASGLSAELLKAYYEFCESLCPQRECGTFGFSIICDRPHNDSYFQYDSEVHFFKKCLQEDEEEWQQQKAIWFPDITQPIGQEIEYETADAEMGDEDYELESGDQDQDASETEDESIEDEDTSEQFDQIMVDAQQGFEGGEEREEDESIEEEVSEEEKEENEDEDEESENEETEEGQNEGEASEVPEEEHGEDGEGDDGQREEEGEGDEDESPNEEAAREEKELMSMLKVLRCKRNYRCEAFVSCTNEQIVRFMEIDPIKPRTSVEVTWGEQYVSCLSHNLLRNLPLILGSLCSTALPFN